MDIFCSFFAGKEKRIFLRPKITLTICAMKARALCLLFFLSVKFLWAQGDGLPNPVYVAEPDLTRTIDQSKAVYAIPASINVAKGNASYTIPIEVPSGINGVTPTVAVSYSSAGGHGLLGWGWHLAAGSEITQSSKVYALDGVKRPMEFTNTDNPLTLDGQRLVLISGDGFIGGSEYRTYIESHQRVTVPDGGGFLVETKNGLKKYYGRTAASQLAFQVNGTGIVHKWLLDEVRDRNGNRMLYDYILDAATNSYRLNRIQYIIIGQQSPKAEVRFYYTSRTDVKSGYIDGEHGRSEALLQRIASTYNGTHFSEYRFKYSFRSGVQGSDYSRLVEIDYEGRNRSGVNSTLVQWHNAAPEFELDPDLNPELKKTSEDLHQQLIMDINGDGLDDILSLEYTKIDLGDCWHDLNKYQMSRHEFELWANIKQRGSDNFTREKILGPITSEYKPDGCQRIGFCKIYAGDFNGDGLMDFLLHRAGIHGSGKNWWNQFPYDYYLNTRSNPGTFTKSLTHTHRDHLFQGYENKGTRDEAPNMYPFALIPADFDGDGITDIGYMGSDGLTDDKDKDYEPHVLITYTNPDLSIQKERITNNGNSWGELDSTRIGDFNGDGKADIMLLRASGSRIIAPVSRNNWIQLYNGSFPNVHHYLQVGDFNGDGISDIMAQTPSISNDFYIKLFDGNTFLPGTYVGANYDMQFIFWQEGISRPANFRIPPYPFIRDVDMDGRDDLVVVTVDRDVAHPYPQYTVQVHYNKITGWMHSSYQIPLHEIDLYTQYEDFYFADFNGSGRPALFYYDYKGGLRWAMTLTFRPLDKSRLVRQILDGYNRLTEFRYDYLSSPAVYTRALNAYPNPSLIGGIPVVSKVLQKDFTGSVTSDVDYSYFSLRYNSRGLGMLGFKKEFTENNLSGIRNESWFGFMAGSFSQQDHLFVPLEQRSMLMADGSLLAQNRSSYIQTDTKLSYPNGNTIFNFPRILESLSSDFIKQTGTRSSNFQYDNAGNVLHSEERIYNNTTHSGTPLFTRITTGTYVSNGSWLNWLPATLSVSSTRAGSNAVSETSSFTYTSEGNLSSRLTQAGSPYALTENFSYNNYGNLLQKTLTPSGMPARTTGFTYTADQRFIATKTNPLSWVSTFQYDLLSETLLTEEDANTLQTTYTYDDLGRLIKTVFPDGNEEDIACIWDVGQTESGALYYKSVSGTYRPTAQSWYSGRLQPMLSKVKNRNNQWTQRRRLYNAKGELWKTSLPYVSGSPQYTVFSYDAYGRLLSEEKPTGLIIENTYTTNSVRTENRSTGQANTKTYDALGQLVSITDAGGSLSYTYNSWNKPLWINSPSDATTMDYDHYGFQTGLHDPAAGSMTYGYNALGELTRQEDARGNVFTMSYDKLGRIKTKNGPDGSYTYGYDDFKGALKGVLSPYNTATGYTYDDFGRLIKQTELVEGEEYTMEYTYNSTSGLQEEVHYPNGLVVKQEYDANGYLNKISRPATGQLIWEYGNQDAFGHLTGYTLGNTQVNRSYGATSGLPSEYYNDQDFHYGFGFNLNTGNLEERENLAYGLTESFSYDALDRLTDQEGAGSVVNVEYENSGNILAKSDVGVYENTSSGQTEVVGEVQNIAEETQLITYTPFNSVATIMEGAFEAYFTYGSDEQRRKMEILKDGDPYRVRTYLFGGLFERDFKDEMIRELAYVYTPGGQEAVYVNEEGTNDYALYLLNRDYLGSVLSITNADGLTLERYSYDAWGNRRNPLTWQNEYIPGEDQKLFEGLFYRGFTGHEHLDCFGLINMNGRLYDPLLGRMLSPDNFVQNAGFTQNFNRYAYVYNNPLKYTDPDGEWVHLAIGAAIGGTFNWIANGAQFNTKGLGYFGVGALAGALGAGVGVGIQTASAGASFGAGFVGSSQGISTILSAGYTSSFVNGALAGAGAGFSAGFVSGSGNSWLAGDSFGGGLVSGLKGGGVGGLMGAFSGGLAGGIRAHRNGLNFWDGSYHLTSEDMEYLNTLTASIEEITNLAPESPGQIDWSQPRVKKAIHMYKWIRYEKATGVGLVQLDKAFSNLDIDDAGIAGSGFNSGLFKIRFGDKVFKTSLDFNIYRTYKGSILTKAIDFNGGSPGQFYRGNDLWGYMGSGANSADYRWTAPMDGSFNFLFNWLGY